MTGIYVQTQEEGAAGGTPSGNGGISSSGGTCSVKGPLLGCNRCWQRSSVNACAHSPLSPARPVKVSATISVPQKKRASVVASFPSKHNGSILFKQGGPVSSPVKHVSVCIWHPSASLPAFRLVRMTT